MGGNLNQSGVNPKYERVGYAPASDLDNSQTSGWDKFITFMYKYVMATMPSTQKWIREKNLVIHLLDAIFRGIA